MAMPLDPNKLRSHNLPPVHWFIIYPVPIGAPCRDELVNFLLPLGPLVVYDQGFSSKALHASLETFGLSGKNSTPCFGKFWIHPVIFVSGFYGGKSMLYSVR